MYLPYAFSDEVVPMPLVFRKANTYPCFATFVTQGLVPRSGSQISKAGLLEAVRIFFATVKVSVTYVEIIKGLRENNVVLSAKKFLNVKFSENLMNDERYLSVLSSVTFQMPENHNKFNKRFQNVAL